MNPETIALLRAESLAATLTAARSRRVRRRVGRIAFAAIVLAIATLSLLPRRPPAPTFIAAAPSIVAPVVAHDIHIIRTPSVAVARIAPSARTLVRFSTEPARRVERIDNADLARAFPDQGIAIIRPQGEPARAVFF